MSRALASRCQKSNVSVYRDTELKLKFKGFKKLVYQGYGTIIFMEVAQK